MLKKFLIFVAIAAAALFSSMYAVRGGRLEAYLDKHPNPERNAKIEYNLATLVNLANRTDSAENRFRRIMTVYGGTKIEPLAWAEVIELIDSRHDRPVLLAECQKFIEKYPDHSKSELIRRKIGILQHGY